MRGQGEREATESSAVRSGKEAGAMARALRPEGQLIGYPEDFGRALAETTAALAVEGDVTLFEPAFSAAGMATRCDILERRAGRYRLTEVKASTSVKPDYIVDVAYQVAALKAAGIPIESAHLQFIDREFVYQGDGDYRRLFRTEDLTGSIKDIEIGIPARLKDFQLVLRGDEPMRERGSHCERPWPCAFQERCAVGEPEFPVAILGMRNKAFLQAAHDGNWRDVRDVPGEAITSAQATRIWQATRSGKAILTTQARDALGAQRPRMHYLDFETWPSAVPRWAGVRPYQSLPFQWSLHTDHGIGELEHREFLEDSGSFPVPATAQALIEATRGDAPIAMYTNFEHGAIETMIDFCPRLEEPLRGIQARLLDLHPLAKSSYYHPDMRGSWSIKAVIPTIAPELDYGNLGEIREGGDAMEAYAQIIDPTTSPERKATLARDLKIYCKRDTEAMVALVRHLVSAR
jgi:hypothetical protein